MPYRIDHLISKGKLRLDDIRNEVIDENWQLSIPEIAEAIASSTAIQSIEFGVRYRCFLTTNRILDAVTHNSHVKEVRFDRCQVASFWLRRILRQMRRNLESLSFSMVTFFDKEAISLILQSETRKVKKIAYKMLNDRLGEIVLKAVVKSLCRPRSSLNNLCLLTPTENGLASLSTLAEILQHHTSFEELVVGCKQGISNEKVAALALAVEQTSTLKRLVVYSESTPATGTLRLLQSLSANSTVSDATLKGLTVDSLASFDSTGNTNYTLKTLILGAAADRESALRLPFATIPSILHAFRSLEALQLSCWRLGSQDMQLLCDELRRRENFKSLNLRDCIFDRGTIGPLCEYLRSNNTLANFSLIEMDLREEEYLQLSASLKQCQSVKSVVVKSCQIGNAGMKHMTDLLIANQHLKSLTFDKIAFSEEGLICLGNALKLNRELEKLVIIGQQETQIGINTLLEGHRHHRKLQLYFDGPGADASQVRAVNFYNTRNASLCRLLNAEHRLPLYLWPNIMYRASRGRYHLSMLYFLVKEKSDLFQRASNDNAATSQNGRRGRRNAGAGRKRKRQRTRV